MNKKKEVLSFKKNLEITAREVRVLSDEGAPVVMRTAEAIRLAEERGEDLVLINEKSDPPIAKIIDYGKYVYQQKKRAADAKKNSQQVEVKEIRLSVNIDTNDINVKAKKIKEFIEGGHKVKCFMQLKGRQNANPDRGQVVMLKLAQMVEDIASAEALPKLEGKRWIMFLKPIKKKQ